MKKSTPQFLIYTLVILAFVTASISPVCNFSGGGKNFIEICASDGTLKTIEVPSNLAPTQNDQKQHSAEKECAFCFAKQNLEKSQVSTQHAIANISLSNLPLSSKNITFSNAVKTSAFRSRAPPV